MNDEIKRAIYQALTELQIPFDSVTHPTAHTIADCQVAEAALHCVVPKNLFLTPRNQSVYYLCLVRPNALFRTADVSKQLGVSRLSFAPPEALSSLLRTHAGAISPMGLIFPEAADVRLAVDVTLRRLPRLGFHPNDNDETLAMAATDFFDKYLKAIRRAPVLIALPDAPREE